MKPCKTCGVNKPLEDFPKQSSEKDGRRPHCRECFNEREADKQRARYAIDAEYRETCSKKNKARGYDSKKSADRYAEKFRDKYKTTRIKKREALNSSRVCKECDGSMAGRHINAKFCSIDCTTKWHTRNAKPSSYYRDMNPEMYAKSKSAWAAKARRENPSRRIAMIFRRRLWGMINRGVERSSEILGYTWDEYRIAMLCRDTDMYLKWRDNMSDYHIDHIIPVTLYNADDRNELQKCWNPRNLRIVEKEVNIRKSDVLDMDLVEHYHINDLLPEGLVTSPMGA